MASSKYDKRNDVRFEGRRDIAQKNRLGEVASAACRGGGSIETHREGSIVSLPKFGPNQAKIVKNIRHIWEGCCVYLRFEIFVSPYDNEGRAAS